MGLVLSLGYALSEIIMEDAHFKKPRVDDIHDLWRDVRKICSIGSPLS
ncbi:hypothetical protein [Algoriphagus boritolerans]